MLYLGVDLHKRSCWVTVLDADGQVVESRKLGTEKWQLQEFFGKVTKPATMAKRKKNPIREDRIQNEAIVDAYGPEEQAMGWYYYLENKIRFPFLGKCIVAKVVSPLLKGETVEVRPMAPEDACSADMLVLIRWHGRRRVTHL
jgi:Calcium binding